jgi:hypothetical protein
MRTILYALLFVLVIAGGARGQSLRAGVPLGYEQGKQIPLAHLPASASVATPDPGVPAESSTGTPDPHVDLAIATNLPLLWTISQTFSAWIGPVRINVARYPGADLSVPKDIEDLNISIFGHTTDVGIGWTWQRHGFMRGTQLEVGPLLRFRHNRNYVDDNDVAHETRDSTIVAGRALVSHVVHASSPLFLALAIGVSAGYERGTKLEHDMDRATRVSALAVALETYVRIGVSLGR